MKKKQIVLTPKKNKKLSKQKRKVSRFSQSGGNQILYSDIKRQSMSTNKYVIVFTLILVVMGLIMLYSASYPAALSRFGDSQHYIKDQIFFAIIGIAAMFIISHIDYHFYIKILPLITFVTYILLIAVLFMTPIKGCRRWISIPGIGSFQPSEIAKFYVIVYFSFLTELHNDKMNTFKYGFMPFILILGSIAGLMVLEPHLSGTIIILFVGCVVMFIGGASIKMFAICAGILEIGLPALIIIKPDLIPYAQTRINIWQHPELDLGGAGYQSYQSLLAIGSGGLFGKGIGNSMQKHMFLPEPQNDFIFSIVCEELGFVGAVMIILLFLGLFISIFFVAFKAKDKYGTMLCVGIGTQITLQALLNIAVATNSIPNTGISLPFFSEGGTSLLMLLGEIGVVLSVSREANKKICIK